MRVISGTYRSRKLLGYGIEGIRPTMDKVKESAFAMINSYVKDSIFLDLFSGTGAIGIEALSLDASKIYFIDNNKKSIDTIKINLFNLKITSKTNIINDNYTSALKKFNINNIKFDIIYVDPPYGVIKIESVLNNIIKYDVLKNNGIVVCEYEDEKLLDNYEYLTLFKSKSYGNKYIKIYKNGK